MHNPYAALSRKLLGAPLALRTELAPLLVHQLLLDQQHMALAAPIAEEDIDRGYDVIEGVAIIPVQGVLVSESNWLTDYFGMTGYDTIGACLRDAMTDPAIDAVVLDIDSPGGEVSGCFDLADTILGLRGRKPLWAIVDDGAYSAAYAIASAADRIVASRAGGAGSIGVITLVPDISKLLADNGIVVNMVHYGDAKTDGQPYAAMSDDARARIQSRIDQYGEIFVSSVARHRGMDVAAVRATQAQCFLAADALAAGLIDAVMAPDDAFAALLATLN